ncbi:unnamed protein product [Rotaria socialis]|uniref:Uncharacterized protein n=1 Tax=Rotaria socialis TaxID=392032 RepID=A0A817X5F8_9BILA|nr:unnamed protein product [Rotaria socialis]CAF4603406.1 unnamed protein product [Rotaria socialis]
MKFPIDSLTPRHKRYSPSDYRSKIKMAPNVAQPSGEHFANTFSVVPSEDVLKYYECKQGCSDCCGPRTTIALTNQRLVIRSEQSTGCCCKTHADSAIFLEDIQIMREAANATSGRCLPLLVACLTCTWPLFLCQLCCASCCGDRPKILQFAVGGGNENVTFKIQDARMAAIDISQAILAAKGNAARH